MPPTILSPPETMASYAFYRLSSQDRLSLSIFLGFSLLASERLVPLAEALKGAMEALLPYGSIGLGLDVGLPKPSGEFLVAGSAFAPSGSREKALAASFAVGPLRRDFLVVGPKPAGSLKPGSAEAIASWPLDWASTAYHEDFNPSGLKPGGSLTPDGPPLAGPLLVEVDYDREGRLSQDAFTKARPASPLPLPATSGRLKNLGTFDQEWVMTASPGFPRDFDWSYFNVAQKEQRLSSGYFKGDERIEVAGANPNYPKFDVKLPGLVPRIFYLTPSVSDRILELRPDLDTIWLFPTSGVGLLIFRAQLTVKDELASDVPNVYVSLTKLGAPYANPRDLVMAAQNHSWPSWPMAGAVELEFDEPKKEPVSEPPLKEPLNASPPPDLALPPPLLTPTKIAAAVPVAAGVLLNPALTAKAKAAALISESRKALSEDLPAVNEALKELNLPPLTEQSLEPYFKREEKTLTKVLENQNLESDEEADLDLKASFTNLGLDPQKAENLAAAVDLPIPNQADFLTTKDFDLAFNEYGRKWSALMGLPLALGASHAEKIKALGSLGSNPPKALSSILGPLPGLDALPAQNPLDPGTILAKERAEFMESTQKLGLSPDSSERLFQNLSDYETALDHKPDLSLAEREALTLDLGQKFEASLNLPAGEITNGLAASFTSLRSSFYGSESLGLSLMALTGLIPGLKSFLPAINRLRLDPNLPQKSLIEIAKDAGVSDFTTLKRLADLDQLNPSPAPAPLPLAMVVDEAPLEPIAIEPAPLTPSQIFQSRAAVANILNDPNIRAEAIAKGVFPGAVLANLDLRDLDFSNLDLQGADFSESDLSGATLTGINARRAVFYEATLSGSVIADSNFAGANFIRANCQGLSFKSTILTEADFSEADLTGADFSQTVANGVDFSLARLSGAFSHASLLSARFLDQNLDGANFSGALLDRAFFERISLKGANFSQASLKETAFFEVKAPKAIFREAKGENARFLPGCDLTRADFRGAFLRDAVFQESLLIGADFTGCRALRLSAAFLNLATARLRGAYLREACFFGSNLSGADVSGSDLLGASLGSSDLRGANLAGASLYGADLYRIRLDHKTLFQGADLNDTRLKLEGLSLLEV
ncbi:MAG: pentapeptide repeat-containing protein [Deltaproteobacteria bacterium]|jgi:uncharacterized protein YjbI with pentapeptide repeats|nr:pentapeptide repeat-containing protein [Deltaproteobacteria bacterium]